MKQFFKNSNVFFIKSGLKQGVLSFHEGEGSQTVSFLLNSLVKSDIMSLCLFHLHFTPAFCNNFAKLLCVYNLSL